MQKVISKAELFRLQAMALHENSLSKEGYRMIAGVDEAGRGPLAGPVVAAACILPKNHLFVNLNDSKQLKPETRERLYEEITTHPETCFAIWICDAETIDRINILQATFLAMQRAVGALSIKPDYLLVDGNRLPRFAIPALAIVQGDGHSISIAAASVIAKVTRDRMMDEYDRKWPCYGFKKHKGYGTEEHRAAIKSCGPCPLHRRSFEPMKSAMFYQSSLLLNC